MAAIPTIVAFRNCLKRPSESFRTLGGMIPETGGDGAAVFRTSRFAEARVRLEGKWHLLCVPIAEGAVEAVERTAAQLRFIRSSHLCEYRILYSEMSFSDELGRTNSCDVILQSLPDGEPFSSAAAWMEPARLRRMIGELHEEFIRLGFSHNNLKPSNLIVGDDGILHPIRYHYATIGEGCRDDFRALYAAAGLNPDEDGCGTPQYGLLSDIRAPYSTEGAGDTPFTPHEGLIRIIRNGLYGFADEDMETVIAPQYLWADDFREGRAVVETADGLGLIDKCGREVIPAVYDDVCYDVHDGTSLVRRAGMQAVFDYDGRRTEEFLQIKHQ